METVIRKATIKDIKEIHSLLNGFAEKGALLPRSLSDLYDHLRDYAVFQLDSREIVGVAALHICWEDLAEVRSLAVREEHQGKGIGRRLVEFCLSEALTLGIYRVFTLTYEPGFFERLGFKVVDKALLPHKVWADCIRCSKFPDCDEVAMIMEM